MCPGAINGSSLWHQHYSKSLENSDIMGKVPQCPWFYKLIYTLYTALLFFYFLFFKNISHLGIYSKTTINKGEVVPNDSGTT